MAFNESVLAWEKIQNYCLGNECVRQEIEKLHFNIESTVTQRFLEMTNAGTAQQIAEKIEGLDHKAWVQSLSHTAGSMGIVVNVMGLLMLLFYLLLIKPQQLNMKELLLNMWINKITH